MENIISETSTYKLVTGISPSDNQLCYQLVNKSQGVIEVETKILPQAYQYLTDLTSGLEEAFSNNKPTKGRTDNLRSIK